MARPPEEDRLITYAHEDGLLYEMPIVEFVVLQTSRMIIAGNDDIPEGTEITLDEVDSDQVTRASGDVAALLMTEGWFTREEYEIALAKAETETLMEELKELGGETT